MLQGDFASAVKEVEKTSEYLSRVCEAVNNVNGVLIITSSYGGVEDFFNVGTGVLNKKRTKNLVPFLIIGRDYEGKSIGLEEAPNNDISLLASQGSYLDIVPTILRVLDLELPPDLEGESFV